MAETTISEQIVREAPDIEAYKLGLLQSAKTLSEQPMTLPAYQTAGLSAMQQGAASLAQQGIGSYAPYLQAGQQAMEAGINTLGYGANLAAGLNVGDQYNTAERAMKGAMNAAASPAYGYQPGMAAAFMNPYQQMVTQNSLAEMRRQADIARQGQAAQAVQSGAFGGTREGVQRAEFERNVYDQMNQRIMQDYAQNFAQAQNAGMTAFEQQQQRAINQANLLGQLGSTYGQMAGQQGQLGLQQANALSNYGQLFGQLGVQQAALGQSAQQMGLYDINALSYLGQIAQQNEQARLDAARATQLQQTMAPYQQTAFLSDIYKGAPSTQMSLTGTSAPSTSPLLQAAGLGISGLAAATGAQKAGLFG